jgi:AAA domain
MRLVQFSVQGYKRFEGLTKVNLDGKLIALTGSNEAGKSSLLDALAHLNDETPFAPGELTRRTEIAHDQVVVEARFLLEAGDRDAVAHLHDGGQIRWFVLRKYRDGEQMARVEPIPKRDREARETAHRHLTRLQARLTRDVPEGQEETAADDVRALHELVDQSTDIAAETAERLSSSALATIETSLAALRPLVDQYGQTGERALVALKGLHEDEQVHPADQAVEILLQRRPLVLRFGDDERTLHSQYDLFDDVPSLAGTAAIHNLAALADLNLESVRLAVEQDDPGLADTLIRDANNALEERFRISWRQSEVAVRSRMNLL